MTTYQLQAEYMVKKNGIATALKDARRFVQSSDKESRTFWQYVIVWLERFAVQSAAMGEKL